MKKIKLELPEDVAKLVLEGLIFFSSVDVVSSIEAEDAEKIYPVIEELHKILKPKYKDLSVKVYGSQKTFEQQKYSPKLKRLLISKK